MKIISLLFMPLILSKNQNTQINENTNGNIDIYENKNKDSLKSLNFILSKKIFYKKSCLIDDDCENKEKCCYTKYKNFCCSQGEYVYYTFNPVK